MHMAAAKLDVVRARAQGLLPSGPSFGFGTKNQWSLNGPARVMHAERQIARSRKHIAAMNDPRVIARTGSSALHRQSVALTQDSVDHVLRMNANRGRETSLGDVWSDLVNALPGIAQTAAKTYTDISAIRAGVSPYLPVGVTPNPANPYAQQQLPPGVTGYPQTYYPQPQTSSMMMDFQKYIIPVTLVGGAIILYNIMKR